MSNKKIAVIEDDISIQLMYKYRLEMEGFEVGTASDGLEGLELVKSFVPHLILLDYKMPRMNGDEMLERVRANEEFTNMKVIILTNISRDEAPRSLQFLNVDRYIVKAHSTPGQLCKIINNLLAEKT